MPSQPTDGRPRRAGHRRWSAGGGRWRRALRRHCLRWALAAARDPRPALALWAAVTLVPLPGLAVLTIDTDGHALVPADDPAVHSDARTRERFGLRDPVFVVLDSGRPGGALQPATLARLVAITARLRELPGIDPGSVISLATERCDRLLPGSHDSFVPFLVPFPDTPERLAALESALDAPAAAVYTGTLVSADRRAVAVLAGIPDGGGTDRRALFRRVEAAVAATVGGGERVLVVGAPAAEALLGDHVVADLGLLLPLSAALLAAVLWLGTRRLTAVAIVAAKALFCVAWTFGLLGALGIPVYLTVVVLPVVLVAVSMADELHLLMGYQRALAAGALPPSALRRTLGALVTPVVLATAATAAGFCSLMATPIAPLRALGLGTALGVLYSLGFSLTATPALLALLPAGRLARRAAPATGTGATAGERSGARAVRLGVHALRQAAERPAPTLGVVAAITLVAAAGLPRLVVDDGWIQSFAEGSPFRRATEDVDRLLHGTHLLRLHLERPANDGGGGGWADPVALDRLGDLERFLGARPGVGGALGLHSQLVALAHFWGPRNAAPHALRDRREVRRLLNRYELSPGLARRREVVTDDASETVVTVFLKDANYRDTQALIERVDAFAERRLTPIGASLRYAGDVAVSQATIPAIVRSQVLSLPLAALGVLAVVTALYGSFRLALCALLPVALATFWLLGAMGWAGMPLGVANSIFFSVALGLGVDAQSIHFLHRYRLERRSGRGAVARTLAAVAPPIAVNSAAVAAGFGLLAFSSVPANARLGVLVALALLLGALLSTAGLGAVFQAASRRRPLTAGSPGE